MPETIHLRFATRNEIEASRTDIDRFLSPTDYHSPWSLDHFRDPHLKDLFIRVYLKKDEETEKVFAEALSNYPGSKSRIIQAIKIARCYLNQ